MHRFDSDGVRLWYKIRGNRNGPPVVALHGGPGEGSQTLAHFAGPSLEPHLRMIYLDERGSARSQQPTSLAAYTIPIMVDDVERLRRHLGVPRISLLAHSFGTILALEYAKRYPARVSRIVLAAAVPDVPAMMRIQCAALARNDQKAYARAVAARSRFSAAPCNAFAAYPGLQQRTYVYRNMFPDPAVARAVDEVDRTEGGDNNGRSFEGIFAHGFEGYRFGNVRAVAAPVLIIAGTGDRQASIAPQRALAHSLPRGRILEYPGASHFMFVDRATRFGRDVAKFLGKQ